MKFLITLLITTILFFVSCKQEDKFDEKKYSEEFRGYAKEYLVGLKTVLMKNMHEGGPLKAVTVCSDTAADLTKLYSETMKLKVKRVSYKNRNSENYPDEYEQKGIDEFIKLLSENNLNEKTEIIKKINVNGEESIRYLKPILIEAPCLNCHGNENEIIAEVKDVIKKNYPDDKAIGYKIGDLRGAISITQKL
ncbi:MAG: DUF3365 domain-containing protein [Ignavibacteriae bacterium]|nr:DUF3365 domain-containing protein [Ignavibacteriota bacterium]